MNQPPTSSLPVPGGEEPAAPPRLRIFVSSPGDVDTERKIAARVLGRLAGEFRGRLDLKPYFWEDEPMRQQRTFQDQIPATADFDVVVCILWSRLGTPLTGPDGRQYAKVRLSRGPRRTGVVPHSQRGYRNGFVAARVK